MHKHLAKKKLAGLLALSLLFSSVPAWAAEDSAATSTEAAAPAFYDLNFDAKEYTQKTLYLKDKPVAFRAFEGCQYTAYPVAGYKEQLNIYIPEAYFQKKSVGNYKAATAPIFIPLASSEAIDGTIAAPEDSTSENSQGNLALLALAHGYVVAIPAAQSLTPPATERLGKAPQAIISYKAAIRYLRRNQHSLPAGNTNRIVVMGEGTSGSLALQLAASANQPIYQPYLYALGAAGRSDQIFAAQVYAPVTGLAKDYARFGWTLPDGRPDPNAFNNYAPLLDTEASLDPKATPHQESTEAVEEKAVIEEAAHDSSKASLKAAGEDTKAATGKVSGKDTKAANDKVSNQDTKKQPVPVIYDTKEYRDFLARQAEYEKVAAEAKEFIETYTPNGHTSRYLRLCAPKTNDPELQSLEEAFAASDTVVTGLDESIEPLQDAEGLFAWIDAANAERNEIDQRLGKLWQKQNAKLARAKLLADRAAAKARKAQSKIERQAKQNGGQVPYAIVKTDKQ